jgi:long-subunit fatty acid transport protein
MANKSLFFLIILYALGYGKKALAQNYLDLQRFSETSLTGTARSLGMGGAFSAVGGDFTSATLNPAGLGLFQRSEITFSPALQFFNTNSSLWGQSNRATMSNFSIPSMGFVLHSNTRNKRGIVNWAFGFGFNQLNQFRREVDASGYNPYHSISTYFSQIAQGERMNDLLQRGGGSNSAAASDLAAIAFNTYFTVRNDGGRETDIGIINTKTAPNGGPLDGNYFGIFEYGGIRQNYLMQEKGRLNQWDLAFGANVDDVLHFGFGLGILDANYDYVRTTYEQDVDNRYRFINLEHQRDTLPARELEVTEFLRTRGIGVNFKLGLIYQPVDFFRIGASIQTPSYLSLSDRYETQMQLTGNFGERATYNSTEDLFDYSMTLPYRFNLGATVVVKKMAILSADLELVDYKFAQLSPARNFRDVNQFATNNFAMGYNMRFGGELRLENFYLRLGYARFANVLEDKVNSALSDPATHNFTGGLGHRGKNLFFDFAYVHQIKPDAFSLYSLEGRGPAPILSTDRTFANIVFTFGVKIGKTKDDIK